MPVKHEFGLTHLLRHAFHFLMIKNKQCSPTLFKTFAISMSIVVYLIYKRKLVKILLCANNQQNVPFDKHGCTECLTRCQRTYLKHELTFKPRLTVYKWNEHSRLLLCQNRIESFRGFYWFWYALHESLYFQERLHHIPHCEIFEWLVYLEVNCKINWIID